MTSSLQRLVTNGFSHSKVSLIYILSVTFLTLIYTFLEIKYLYLAVLLVLLLGFIVEHKYAANSMINDAILSSYFPFNVSC